MAGTFATVNGEVAESPPGAGFDTNRFSVAAVIETLAGMSANRAVELRTVVVKGAVTPCTLATVAA
jgi:hypothetical protein